jgi:hypothetical protein
VLLDVTDLFAFGIGCDIAGAWLLARGLLLSPHALWVRFTWAGVEQRFVDEARDRTLAVFGIAALIGGFAIQALGYALSLAVESDTDASADRALVAVAFAVLAVALVLGVEAVTRRRRLRSLLLRVARADPIGDGTPAAPTVRVLTSAASAIGVERRDGEDDVAYARRAFGVEDVRVEPPPKRVSDP